MLPSRGAGVRHGLPGLTHGRFSHLGRVIEHVEQAQHRLHRAARRVCGEGPHRERAKLQCRQCFPGIDRFPIFSPGFFRSRGHECARRKRILGKRNAFLLPNCDSNLIHPVRKLCCLGVLPLPSPSCSLPAALLSPIGPWPLASAARQPLPSSSLPSLHPQRDVLRQMQSRVSLERSE